MPVHNCPGWPLYQTQDEIYIRAIKISSIDIELDGTGTAYFGDGYSPQHLSQIFLSVAKPEEGNYLFSSGYGELLYLERDKFEEMCTPVSGSVRMARHIDDLVFEQPEDYSGISAVVMALQAQHNELLHALIEADLMEKE